MISLSSTITRQVVARYKSSLLRSEPSKIELECAKEAMNHILHNLGLRKDEARKAALMKRRMGETDEAITLTYHADRLEEIIAEFRNLA